MGNVEAANSRSHISKFGLCCSQLRQLCGRHGGKEAWRWLATGCSIAVHCAQFIIASRANPAASQYINKRGHAALYIHVSTGSISLSLTPSPSLSLVVARLDKEFVGPFGLMLPDVTQLPATFDVLLANLQVSLALAPPPAEVANDWRSGGMEEWTWNCRRNWQWEWD